MSSWLPTIPWLSKRKPEPSPAAQFLYKHKETVITFAISFFAANRSPGLTMAGYCFGIVVQVFMARKTELDKCTSLVIEITDEGKTTNNDILRHAIPTVVGTVIPSLRILTDTFVGFASGGMAIRKVVHYAGPYMHHISK